MSELTQLIKDESGERKKIKHFFEDRYNNIFMEKDTFVNNRALHKISTTLLRLSLLHDKKYSVCGFNLANQQVAEQKEILHLKNIF